jgi:hypothetical protein
VLGLVYFFMSRRKKKPEQELLKEVLDAVEGPPSDWPHTDPNSNADSHTNKDT